MQENKKDKLIVVQVFYILETEQRKTSGVEGLNGDIPGTTAIFSLDLKVVNLCPFLKIATLLIIFCLFLG